jgi:hypothetical protein
MLIHKTTSYHQVLESEAIRKLKSLQDLGDSESAHADADGILCDFLQSMGCSEIVSEFKKVLKWYA